MIKGELHVHTRGGRIAVRADRLVVVPMGAELKPCAIAEVKRLPIDPRGGPRSLELRRALLVTQSIKAGMLSHAGLFISSRGAVHIVD